RSEDNPMHGAYLDRRRFLGLGAAGLAAVRLHAAADSDIPGDGELLPNGIRLPMPWPPRNQELPADPAIPPYLKSPPPIIPIDAGRQLFVDDFLVEHSTLTRTFHRPEEHPNNPILIPDKPWERTGRGPMAMVFSDGVWYDPKDRLFKMWYLGGYGVSTCHAHSEDGVRWTRPELDVVKGTNIVQPEVRDSTTVWLRSEEHTSELQSRFDLVCRLL